MEKAYTIGLDIGSASVGWAVLTDDYKLVRKRMKVQGNTGNTYVKKNFWGVRLFEQGETAEVRRLKRTTRRRLARRKNRLNELQKIFIEEIAQIDTNFFHRLQDSFLIPDEKRAERYPVFGRLEEEIAYNQQYPTIYHLRKQLADSPEKADIRLVYLALAHIIKFRGHFLIEGTLDTKNSSISGTVKNFLIEYNQIFTKQEDGSLINPIDETIELEGIFSAKVSRSRKFEEALKQFEEEKSNGVFAQFLKMIVGNTGNFKSFFKLEEDAKIQFSDENYEENLEMLLALIGDEYADVFVAAKNAYDSIELSGILSTKDTQTQAKLSASMIESYQEHQADLKAFKEFIRNELPEKYIEIFKDSTKDGYAGFIDGKTNQEAFHNYLRKTIEKTEGAEIFLDKIQQENFLKKQRNFGNGVIPNQIHLEEMRAILTNQIKYYPFLDENKEKIQQLLTYRIPYFVGPLANGNSQFSWLVRKSDGKINPWNLEEKVDIAQSATNFIERMTNNDLYLPQEKVLPKHSLLYQKFGVLNELTKVSYLDERGTVQNFSGEEKAKIFNQLFKVERKVTQKKFIQFLRNEFNIEVAEVKGIEASFNASYGTYHDLKEKIGVPVEVLEDVDNIDMFEEIIKILTIFEDRKMIEEQLKKYSDRLEAPVLKKLVRRHYTGWGRLSKKLITGIYDKQSQKNILDYLLEDDGPNKNINRNFMQLINDDALTFKSVIQKAQINLQTGGFHEAVNELAGSPAIKKGILQSLKIVDEIVSIMGYDPANIVIEMARENQTTAQGIRNSKPRLKRLEEAIKGLGSDILKTHSVSNNDLQNDRLYLYYLQNGKDLYTGENLSINKLSNYEIDHIIPQSFIKDNSIDNLALVSLPANGGKSDNVPNRNVVNKMEGYWEKLRKSGLISQRKFDNLTKSKRGGLTEEDKAGFIKRQLVETRQITKNVANILDQQFNHELNEKDKKVKIVTLKSSLTSQFRKDFKLYKLREINDYHHAHDAYLNGVVAVSLLKVYPRLEPEFVYGTYPKFNAYRENKATAKKAFYSNLLKFFKEDKQVTEDGEIVWDAQYLGIIKQVLQSKQMNIVKKVEIQKGGFSKESIKEKGSSKKLIPRKENWDTTKYGGLDSPIIAYSVIISYEKGKQKKVTKTFVGITIMNREKFEKDEVAYLKAEGFENPTVLAKLPKYTLFELENGRRRMIASAVESQKGNQMVLPNRFVELLHHAKRVDELSGKSRAYLEEHRETFVELLVYVLNFAEEYTKAPARVKEIISLYEQNKEADLSEVASSFVNLMQFNKMGAPADFKFFGKTIGRLRYKKMSELLNATVIHQSVTGLFEYRRELGD